MHSKWRFVCVFILCVAACQCAAAQKRVPAVSVQCCLNGDFGIGKAWWLEVKPNGAALLSFEGIPKETQRKFKVSPGQLAELIRVINTEHFFDLHDTYGGNVPDSGFRILRIVCGRRRKTITLRFLVEEDLKRPEIKRAFRVWNTIRKWFHDADAADADYVPQ